MNNIVEIMADQTQPQTTELSTMDRVRNLMNSIEQSQKAMKGMHDELKLLQKELVKADKKCTKKVKKDPNTPKRPISAFIFFCNDHRENIKKQNPEMKQTDITVKLGQMWKDVKAKDKHKYEQLAATDKKRYETEKAKLTDTQ